MKDPLFIEAPCNAHYAKFVKYNIIKYFQMNREIKQREVKERKIDDISKKVKSATLNVI